MPDVDMSSLVSSEVTAPTTTATTSISNACSNVMIKNEYIEPVEFKPDVKPPVIQQLSTQNGQNGRAKMTLGQMALAGIVISSGPGDHFETYEGTKKSPNFELATQNLYNLPFSLHV